MPECTIEDLSTEILISIFSFLSLKDISRLRCTCRRLRDVINSWDHVFFKTTTIVSNQNSGEFIRRCYSIVPSKIEKLRLQHNWKHGIYNERSVCTFKRKYRPWLEIDKENVWLSKGSHLFNYKRSSKSIMKVAPNLVINTKCYYEPSRQKHYIDITRFTINKNLIVGGLSNGGIFLQNALDKSSYYVTMDADTFTSSVDISKDQHIVAGGMRNDCFQIFSVHQDPLALTLIHTQELDNRVWCVSFCNEKSLFACGTSHYFTMTKVTNSIYVYDTESFSEAVSLKLKSDDIISSTHDIKWDGPNGLWSCGNDSYIRRWDLRTGQCEQKFFDVFGYSLYCLDYDYYNTIMVGAYMHGRVSLWDSRAGKCIQFYFMRDGKGNNIKSPVYSLSFDSQYLFAGLDQGLNILDFSVYRGEKRDYTDVFRH